MIVNHLIRLPQSVHETVMVLRVFKWISAVGNSTIELKGSEVKNNFLSIRIAQMKEVIAWKKDGAAGDGETDNVITEF